MNLPTPWKEHFLTQQGVVEEVSTEWLYKYCGHDVSTTTDLQDGTEVTMEELWFNIKNDGIYEPLIIRVGIETKTFRLESGNHRIKILKEHGVKTAPATVEVVSSCGPTANNPMNTGSHIFSWNPSVLNKKLNFGYYKPSDIFPSI